MCLIHFFCPCPTNSHKNNHKGNHLLIPSSIQRQEKEDHYPNLGTCLTVGGIFGYVDFALEKRQSFDLVCSRNGTTIAEITRESFDKLEREDTTLHHMIEKVLLQASLMELANVEVM
mmetsp:Transcript_6035/g.8784  ORF Transcript_6035/g.8784 Transcript_6035/m.8784 type:complete len:117 (-) Transcript_6035:86-436(-)